MSKPRIGIAVLVVAAVLSGAALARGGGGHGGGGHGGGGHGGGGHGGGGHGGGGHFGGGHGGGHGLGGMHFGGGHHAGARFAVSHSFSQGGRNFGQIRNTPVRSGSIRSAMNSLSRAGGLRSGRLLSNPAARGQIAAAAALAGWHGGGHGANGWWQHGGGGYGWVGPLFWPFAYNDIYDYTIWGDDGFWDYGYPDIYAGIFAPYGYDDLAGYMAQRTRRHDRAPSLAQLCGDDSRDVAGLPIDQIQQAVQPNEAQGAALDELGNASIQAAQTIRYACPTQVASTAPGRLAAMQQRVEAMISAVALMRPPLEKFYGLLDDEQKARFNALAEDQRKAYASRASVAQYCAAAQPTAFQWPGSEIEAKLHLNDTQRAPLQMLQDTTAKAADMLKVTCQPDDVVTPPARLAALAKRLDTMLQAVKMVRPALENFYSTLNDEQKAQFEAIGPKRTA
jgi:hypothetical protein